MKILFAGSKSEWDPGYIKWYLGILHSSKPITKIIFLTNPVSGDYRAAKEWAMANRINHSEFPLPDEYFLEYEKEIDACVCFKASYTEGSSSKKIRDIAEKLSLPIIFPPVEDSK